MFDFSIATQEHSIYCNVKKLYCCSLTGNLTHGYGYDY